MVGAGGDPEMSLGRVLNYPDRYLSRYLCDVIFSVQQIRESVKA